MLKLQNFEKKGLGVITDVDIKPGETLEICKVIIIPNYEVILIQPTVLYNYCFAWPRDIADFVNCNQPENYYDNLAIATGFGSFYNHSGVPNAKFERNVSDNNIKFTAIAKIAKNSEITINYLQDCNNDEKLWFENVEKKLTIDISTLTDINPPVIDITPEQSKQLTFRSKVFEVFNSILKCSKF